MAQPTLKTTQGPRSAKVFAVDYPSRTWARFTTNTIPVAMNASPALIRSEIASGRFTVDGRVKLNGREAVKVSWADTIGPSTTHVILWVDSRTYVLLRSVSTDPWGPGMTQVTGYPVHPQRPAHRRPDGLGLRIAERVSRRAPFYGEQRAKGLGHRDALRRLANRLTGILRGCLKTRTLYDEATAWGPPGNPGQSSAAA